MKRCPECGCNVGEHGICSNCQEELFILEEQAEFVNFAVSPKFTNKAREQKSFLEETKRYRRPKNEIKNETM